MPLDDLPHTLLVLGEGCVFGVDLRLVLDSDLLIVVSQDLDTAVVELCLVDRDDGSNGVGHYDDHHWDVLTIELDNEIGPHCTKDLSLQRQVDYLSLSRFDDTCPDVRSISTNSLGLLILLDNLELGSQVVLVDDLDLLGFCMPQEARLVFEEVHWGHADLGNQAFSLDWHGQHVLTNTF